MAETYTLTDLANMGGESYTLSDLSKMAAPQAAVQAAPQTTQPQRGKFDLRGEGYDRATNYSPRDAIAGGIRGTGSIGATILRPFESSAANQQRRTSMDEGLTSLLGSDPNSSAYQTNKLLAEVAGTYGAGGAIAKGVSLIPGAARALPTLLPAIESGGMSANGAKGVYGMANRVAGGAVNGAATAGLTDPKDTGNGMMFGAAMAPLVKAGEFAGDVIGGLFRSKPISPVLQKTAQESVAAGYVVPPNMVAPSLKSQALESISGKQATQQIASIKNTETTEKLVRQALGIGPDVPLTKATLEDLRRTAGRAYADVSSLSPQAAADLEALKQARNDAQAWFKSYNRSANPTELATAKQYRATAEQLETALENHAASANRPELIPALRDARKEIAKTFTVGRALNDASGTVDARVLGRMYEKELPLSDGLDTAGKFASAFPTIAKSPQQVGSPAAHNLKAGAAMLAGGMGAGAGAGLGLGAIGTGGLGMAAFALPFVAPPIARSIMFSGPVQRRLAASPGGPGLLSQGVGDVLPYLYRSGGLLSPTSDR